MGSWGLDADLLLLPPGNGTLNKLAGIDFRQLSLGHKLNENQSGEVPDPPPLWSRVAGWAEASIACSPLTALLPTALEGALARQ